MHDTTASLKSLCNQIAAAAGSVEGSRLARLLRLAGLLGESFAPVAATAAAATAPAEPAHPDRVGIWERKLRNGESTFVRRMDRVKEWNYWANLGRIDPKRNRRRVVLLGESVARGYLYDPLFTPAMVLQAILKSRLGDAVEVLDLARTDLGFELGDLARAALILEPDAVVVFAGNNWNVSPPPLAAAADLAALLVEEGIGGLKRAIEEDLAARVRRLVGDVAAAYRERGVPLVWVLPEFNLADWREPLTNAPHLVQGANREWLAAWQNADRAVAADDLQAAEQWARRLVELDQGTCVAGFYVLAKCSRRAGDSEAARRHLENARDAVIWDSSRNTAPRMFGVAQEAMRSEAARQACAVADLPRVFREHLGAGQIPDRRLFIDYCHLTAAGMRLAMAAAAAPLLKALSGADAAWRDLVDERLAPKPEVEAQAAFLAAVHNAHWWQAADVVRHYCATAARTSSAIAQVMTRFVEIQARRTPMLMCRAAEEVANLGSPQLQHYLLRYNYQQLDRVLGDAIVDALTPLGLDAGRQVADLRRDEHGLATGPTDLLAFFYCSAGGQPQEVMWVMPQREPRIQKEQHFYRAYWPESRFAFAVGAGTTVHLSLTCRLPHPSPDAAATLLLAANDRPIAELTVTGAWTSWEILLPPAAIVDGINEVALRWPLPDFPGRQALTAVADNLIDRTVPEFYPCFGEIHSFTAQQAALAANPAQLAAACAGASHGEPQAPERPWSSR